MSIRQREKKPSSKIPFSEEVTETFEKWRRGELMKRLTTENYLLYNDFYLDYGLGD